MRSGVMHFTIKMLVAMGIAMLGIGAIGNVVAYSAVQSVLVIRSESATAPFPKAEFRLSEQQQLQKIFVFKKPL